MAIPKISILNVIKLNRNNFSFKTENKSCYVLACRIEGKSLFSYNGVEHEVKRGDILYIPAGSSYSQTCESETLVCFHLNITGQVSSEFKVFSPNDKDKICSLFLKAEELARHKKSNYEFLCMSVLYEILSYIQISSDNQSKNSVELLKSAMVYLDAHICDAELSLEKVCETSHISRTYFNKLFLENYGCTPIKYIHKERIEHAKQLLTSGSFSNEEIASLCGFNDVKYFYVIFKRLTGFTTKKYIKEFDKLKNNNFVASKYN